MITIKVGICDDEVLQVKINGLYLKDIASRNNIQMEVMGFTSPEQLHQYLKKNELHILFLDIDMGSKSGIQTAIELTRTNPNIIILFITGHREFAGDAFDVEAFGYIVKPVDIQKLERLFKKAVLQVTATSTTTFTEAPFIIVTVESDKKKIYLNDILYIERVRSKSIITTKNTTLNVYESLLSLSSRLNNKFVKINQSEIVNLAEIQDIEGSEVIMKNEERKMLTRSFRKDVLKAYFSI